jgi:cbb3-type cytochrome oxidase subunit 3
MSIVLSIVYGIFAFICSLGVIYSVFWGKSDKVFPFCVMMMLCMIASRLYIFKPPERP